MTMKLLLILLFVVSEDAKFTPGIVAVREEKIQMKEDNEFWDRLLSEDSISMGGPTTTLPPTPTPVNNCVPTTGPCISSFTEFEQVAASATENDVIALCGTIETQSAIFLQQPNLKLCCAQAQNCAMRSSGHDRNLVVTGSDFTLQEIDFFNGNAGDGDGGNVDITAQGHHLVVMCKFHGGQTNSYGGNLHVRNANSLTIERSSFLDGRSRGGGGGVAVWDAEKWKLVESVLENNSGSNGGGAFSSQIYVETGQDITIKGTKFANNSADFGGGYLATTIGTLPSLAIHDCEFDTNTANGDGGAAAVFLYADLSTLDLGLSGNSGAGNQALDEFYDCNDFSIYTDQAMCFGVSQDFP